ncbi:Putative sterigmatocystin biosynthesis peroxidase stcC [Leucoagaricus sp. SymC.cos]|nr:Putative sterigmatocystin biosynthesis peroxidase stcC [Leucoagaricus sp. SymC.cos]
MSFIFNFIHSTGVLIWDTSLALVNLVLPSRPEERVTPEGHPGFGGNWPEYIPPKDGDSRCCCPALNAMANHGILPRDGKNIQFKEMGRLIRTTYNFSPSFCYFVPNVAAQLLKKDYGKDTFDLEELNLHNGIEHDASLCREDVAINPDQGKPHIPYIKELLSYATGKDKDGNPLLTIKDMSRFSSKRRADARASNPEFTLSLPHRAFGSSNSSTILTIFGGRVKDLEAILLEERLPEGWQSRVRKPLGLTLAHFNLTTVMWVELGISEKKYLAEKAVAEAAANPNIEEARSSIAKVGSPTD